MTKQLNKKTAAFIVLCVSSMMSLTVQASSVRHVDHQQQNRHSHIDFAGHEKGPNADAIFASIKDRLSKHIDIPGAEHRNIGGGKSDLKAWRGNWQDHSDRWQKVSDRLDEITAHNKDKFCLVNPAVVTPSAVPVPAAAWLLASGLIGLVGVSRRKAM